MTQKTVAKVFDILSFIALIATAIFFLLYKDETSRINYFVLLMLFVAIFFRMIGTQFKYKALKKENLELKKDLKNLTQILEDKIENNK